MSNAADQQRERLSHAFDERFELCQVAAPQAIAPCTNRCTLWHSCLCSEQKPIYGKQLLCCLTWLQDALRSRTLLQELTDGMEALKARHIQELQLHKEQLSAAVSLISCPSGACCNTHTARNFKLLPAQLSGSFMGCMQEDVQANLHEEGEAKSGRIDLLTKHLQELQVSKEEQATEFLKQASMLQATNTSQTHRVSTMDTHFPVGLCLLRLCLAVMNPTLKSNYA